MPKSRIEGVIVRKIGRFEDSRGWLSELFRHDEIEEEFRPAMAYMSVTRPGVARGPHEHEDQADLFCFVGPSTFRIYLWDNREGSPTHRVHQRFDGGEEDPLFVLVPKGVVHAYKNVGKTDGLVINCPNRLYAGWERKEPVAEIRHEDDDGAPFRLDD